MSREAIIRIVALLLAAAAMAWFVTATEWAEVDVTQPAKGEAAKNRLYATQSVLRTLGARVVRRKDLDALPPARGHLVLASPHWDLFPERAKHLRDWVEHGGHLVMPTSRVDHPRLKPWLPLVAAKSPGEADFKPGKDRDCRQAVAVAAAGIEPAEGNLRICGPPYFFQYAAAAGVTPEWSLHSSRGSEMLRVAVGQGSVTVVGPWATANNEHVLRADNAVALVEALQVGAGSELWFVDEESREPLFQWLWGTAWVALVLLLLALAAFVWRDAPRFGPLAGAPGRGRRSMTEQVAGTGHFLQRHGAAALQAAQVRALHETAARHLRRYARLDSLQRAQAIAAATGLDEHALAQALRTRSRDAAELPADLRLLELARRRIGERPAPEHTAPVTT
ncbi:MAG: DUF4350 domain-containing protein [Ramlibacter sp.]